MTKVLPLRPEPAAEPPALHVRAMDNLAFIRSTMENAGAFTAVSGWGMVMVGFMAIAASFIAAAQPSTARWLDVWLALAAAGIVVQLWAMLAKARASGVPLLSGPGRKFVLAVSPPLLAGAVLTVVLHKAGMAPVLPGLWLLLYGAAVAAGGAFSVEIVPVMGLCFLAAGALALFTPLAWSDWILAIAFGGFHIAFGIPIARRYGG
ncbi:MAG: hypothetical protein M3R65_06780 [Gemmatimonadota bacterium]|nr:hypothetical protein [Gemmatimonadota bacterium]